MRYDEILDSLQNLIKVRPKQREIAEILGLRTTVIGQRASRHSKFSVEDIKKIGDFYKVDLFQNKIIPANMEEYQTEVINISEDDIAADYYPETMGSCGNGVFTLSEHKEKILVPKKIIDGYSKSKTYSVINAYGDSMSPFIQDKDLLVVEPYTSEQIRDNRIYVFCYEDKIFVKRLVLNINQLFIKSDNPMYNPVTVDLKDNPNIHIIGRVSGIMRKVN